MITISKLLNHRQIPQILHINSLNFVEKDKLKSEKIDASRGFLLGKLDAEYLKNIMNDKNNIILIADNGAEAIGYLTAHHISQTKFSNECLDKILELRTGKKILYYHQIAKLTDVKSVGAPLVLEMLRLAKLENYDSVFCRIVHTPRNEVSIKFHQKMGFKEICQIEKEDIIFGIYIIDL